MCNKNFEILLVQFFFMSIFFSFFLRFKRINFSSDNLKKFNGKKREKIEKNW